VPGGELRVRVRRARCVQFEAGRADAVRDDVASTRDERVEHHVELVPDAFDRPVAAPRADRHLEREQLPRRSAGSGGTSCGVGDARRTHDDRHFAAVSAERQGCEWINQGLVRPGLGGHRHKLGGIPDRARTHPAMLAVRVGLARKPPRLYLHLSSTYLLACVYRADRLLAVPLTHVD